METIILNNWSVVFYDPYKAPELQKACLHGKVIGHPRFEDGTEVTTSFIEKLDEDQIITHSGSRYKLGQTDPEYERLYPNAKERLFTSLIKIERNNKKGGMNGNI